MKKVYCPVRASTPSPNPRAWEARESEQNTSDKITIENFFDIISLRYNNLL
jgi:hypothetical protein